MEICSLLWQFAGTDALIHIILQCLPVKDHTMYPSLRSPMLFSPVITFYLFADGVVYCGMQELIRHTGEAQPEVWLPLE
jgi:hypothetical protein